MTFPPVHCPGTIITLVTVGSVQVLNRTRTIMYCMCTPYSVRHLCAGGLCKTNEPVHIEIRPLIDTGMDLTGTGVGTYP